MLDKLAIWLMAFHRKVFYPTRKVRYELRFMNEFRNHEISTELAIEVMRIRAVIEQEGLPTKGLLDDYYRAEDRLIQHLERMGKTIGFAQKAEALSTGIEKAS
jgi:hypothetical protein